MPKNCEIGACSRRYLFLLQQRQNVARNSPLVRLNCVIVPGFLGPVQFCSYRAQGSAFVMSFCASCFSAAGSCPVAARPKIRLARLLASGPPLVYAAIKEVVRDAEDSKFQDTMNRITKSQFATVERLYRSEDQLEGARAFAEKRDPVWKGK